MQKFQTKLKELWEKIKGFFQKLNKKTRILLGVCLVVILAAVILLTLRMNKKEYAVLCTDLSANDISTVVQFLGENGVSDYKIQNDTILVPAGRETQLQFQLMASNRVNNAYLYPYYTEHSGGINSQIQDERAWLISIEQKLAAVVRQFDGVQDATVSIAPGTERLYVLQDSASPSSAAVTITPYGSQPLKNEVVAAIRDIVKHSVQELAIENVSIKDIYGNPYSDTSVISQSSDATALKLQHEEQISNNVRQQVFDNLSSIYGEDNVKVNVLCSVEVARKIVDKTYYDQPNGSVDGGGLITNDTLFWEVIRDGSEPTGGTVGTPTNSNLPNYPDLEDELNGNAQYAGEQIDRDYALNITKEQMEVLEGRLSDLRVIVTVIQKCENSGAMTIDALRDQVSTLAGIGTTADVAASRVHVTIAPFAENTPAGADGINGILLQGGWVLYAAIGGLVLFLILLLVVILLSRRSKKRRLEWLRALEEEMMAAEAAAEAAAIIAAAPPTGGADIMEVNTEKSMELRKNVRQFAQNNPEIAAQMVKAWLKGEESSG